MPEHKFADESEVRVSQLMTLEFANFFGNVYGGSVLALADNTAYVCAARYSGIQTCVTAALDRVDFHEPVQVGELLNLIARIVYVGRTSMEVEVNIYAENIPTGAVRHTNSCHITMVALQDGRPTPVPRLVCRTREDKARYIQAKMRRELSRQAQEERNRFLDQYDQMSDEELDRLISGQTMDDGR